MDNVSDKVTYCILKIYFKGNDGVVDELLYVSSFAHGGASVLNIVQ